MPDSPQFCCGEIYTNGMEVKCAYYDHVCRLIRLGLLSFREILLTGKQEKHDCKGDGQIVRDWLCCSQHCCGVKDVPEQKQYWQIDDSLTADGKNQGRQSGSGGLYGIDEYEQQTHHRTGVNEDTGK